MAPGRHHGPALRLQRLRYVLGYRDHPVMKSAYELAMERLRASDPDAGAPLTNEQKAQLADIERVYQGRIAEREIFLRKQLEDLLAAGNQEEAEKVQRQLTGEKVRLAEEKEAEKDKVRREKAPPTA